MINPEQVLPNQRDVGPPAMVRRRPRSGWVAVDFGELWRYRELLAFFAIRDIKVRYRQAVLGAAWAVLQPVLTMAVFSIFFGRLGRIPSGDAPYPVFVFCALLPWQLFAHALVHSSNSLVENAQTIKKVYFPRLIVPLASVITALVDFAIAGFVLVLLLLYYGIVPGRAVVALPLFTLLAIGAALAAGFWFAALNVNYRDVRYAVPFLTQLWLFVTPVAYPSSLVPARWQLLYGINPMVGVVDGFRWALLGEVPPTPMLLPSIATTVLLLIGGMFYFRRMERFFADVV